MTEVPNQALCPKTSFTETTHIVLPEHANALGTTFGGTAMSWMDICGAISAYRHCGRISVTAFVDEMEFLSPIRVGDVVRVSARLTSAFRTSMEVLVRVEVEDASQRLRTLCVEALFVFVNVDEHGKPCPVPALLLETEEDRFLFEEAKKRREERLARKAKVRYSYFPKD